jgi:hypothetical protein
MGAYYTFQNEKYPVPTNNDRLLLNELSIKENVKFSKSWEIVSFKNFPEIDKDFLKRCMEYFTTVSYKSLKCNKKHEHSIQCVSIQKIKSYVLLPFSNSENLLKACKETGRIAITFSDEKEILRLRRNFKSHYIVEGDPWNLRQILEKDKNINLLIGKFQYAMIILNDELIDKLYKDGFDILINLIHQIYEVLLDGSYLTLIVPNYNFKLSGRQIRLAWHIDKLIRGKTQFTPRDEKLILDKNDIRDYLYMLNYLKKGERTIAKLQSISLRAII